MALIVRRRPELAREIVWVERPFAKGNLIVVRVVQRARERIRGAEPESSGVAALEFDNVYSTDIMLGVRWKFGCCGGGPAPMPVALK